MKTTETSPFRTSNSNLPSAENRLTLGQNRRSNTAQVPADKENICRPPSRRLTKALTGTIDSSQNRCFTFSKDELERAGGEKPSMKNPYEDFDEIQKVVEETKEREGRIRKQLEMLREQALAAVAEPRADEVARKSVERPDFRDQLNKYQSELTSVKDTMENILHFTKQTHNEVQRTKDMVSSIHEMTPNKTSFQSVLDDQEEFIEEGKYSVIEKPGSDEEGIKYVITNEDQQDEFEDDSTEIATNIREKLKFYEKKVFEAESERIEKEKENLQLKESLMRLQAQLKARERELMKDGCKIKFEAPKMKATTCGMCSHGGGGCNLL